MTNTLLQEGAQPSPVALGPLTNDFDVPISHAVARKTLLKAGWVTSRGVWVSETGLTYFSLRDVWNAHKAGVR
jgi:hypothetical protein